MKLAWTNLVPRDKNSMANARLPSPDLLPKLSVYTKAIAKNNSITPILDAAEE